MSVLHPYKVRCVCGAQFEALMAESINAGRMPKARAGILAGTFHRFTCPQCRAEMTIEKNFQYTDLERNTFIKVKPPNSRHMWREASSALEDDVRRIPTRLSQSSGRSLRVVFGLGELREKLLAQDAGLDDRMVELLKVLVIHEHPFLLARSRLRLQLDSVNEERVRFAAAYEHDPRSFRVDLPRWVVDGVMDRQDVMMQWVAKRHGQASIFAQARDYWVNLWRWSPQVSALASLKGYAEALRGGVQIETTTPEFKLMLRFLPRGTHLPSWAKQDVHELFSYAKAKNLADLQDALLELRFNLVLEDDWSLNNDPADIATLWKLLADLPETNVEGNSKIHEILLGEGEGGGWYQPSTRDISIGERELADDESFEDVVRHEIGHAVHEQFLSSVNPWLESQFGWRVFGTKDDEIDQWVDLMGGWGNLTNIQRAQVRTYLRGALGPGSQWVPGPTPTPPNNHPWRAADFGPRLAFEGTGAQWYGNYSNWYRHDHRAFFLNYWYRTLMVVDEGTLKLVGKMPSKYAAMSHFEFFAELYALYYDLDDSFRDNIPKAVAKWLETNIGPSKRAALAEPAAVAPAAPRGPLPEWHWITRPV